MDDQNPARGSRQAYLALAAVLIASAVAFRTLPLEIFAMLAPVALVASLVFLMVGIILGDQGRARARMERGEGVLARWTLDAALWQEFVRLNQGTVSVPAGGSSEAGVEVVFAHDAVYVAGDYYTMDRTWGTGATLEPSASGLVHIELAQGGLDSYCPLRIPIPPGRHDESARVLQHFNDPAGRG
jgi:hypothetical protein